MQREIKFRIWDGRCMTGSTYHIGNGKLTTAVSTDILMQYTGLKDENGQEIYEGDIVGHLFDVDAGYITGYITFKDGRFIKIINDCEYPVFWVGDEIIGNIYENPALLETR